MERANAQTKIIENDIALLRQDHKELNARFDRHLEIYAQNGKELAALKTEMYNLVTLVTNAKISHDKSDENQWIEINQSKKDIVGIKVKQVKMEVRIAAFSAIGATAASAIVVFAMEKLLL